MDLHERESGQPHSIPASIQHRSLLDWVSHCTRITECDSSMVKDQFVFVGDMIPSTSFRLHGLFARARQGHVQVSGERFLV